MSSDELDGVGFGWQRVNPFGASCNPSRSLREVRTSLVGMRMDGEGDRSTTALGTIIGASRSGVFIVAYLNHLEGDASSEKSGVWACLDNTFH
jgi:hypothetical protein